MACGLQVEIDKVVDVFGLVLLPSAILIVELVLFQAFSGSNTGATMYTCRIRRMHKRFEDIPITYKYYAT